MRRLQRLLAHVHGNGQVDWVQVDWVQVDWAQVDWAQVAAEHGYFDQVHMINNFRAMTRITPPAYLAAGGSERNHVPLGT